MTCQDIRARLPGWVYDDLSEVEMREVRAHLSQCPACQAEGEALEQVRRRLNRVPGPTVSIDLAALYQEAARRQQASLRRWRRIAVSAVGLAALLLLAVLVPRCEVRWQPHQVSLSWGESPPREVLGNQESRGPSHEDLENRLNLVCDLVAALAHDTEARLLEDRQAAEAHSARLAVLERKLVQMRLAMERDVSALYTAQFHPTKSGETR